ncbi:MAG: DUF805 domain-containing protein [Planctomycetaceae bacterium]|jgi:uncharacterized membrane protein YvbJ|nr:DUF805 domain-containing protein [Planctomycetaceae bacterium]
MFCPTCGNNLPANVAFCPQCGTTTSPTNTPAPPNYQQPNYPPTSSQEIGYFDVLKKYCVFRGRARRKEFWMFTLVQSIISLVLFLTVIIVCHAGNNVYNDPVLYGIGVGFLIVLWIFVLATLLPNIGVCVRRLHDTGKSG